MRPGIVAAEDKGNNYDKVFVTKKSVGKTDLFGSVIVGLFSPSCNLSFFVFVFYFGSFLTFLSCF